MPWYKNNIPTEWETALERRSGSKFTTEIIYDPPGANVTFSGKYDLIDASPVEQIKDLDPELALRPVVKSVRLTLNDPDQYLDPENSSGLFYNESPVGKDILVNIDCNESGSSKIMNIFTGRIDVEPEAGKGVCSIICSPRRRYVLQQKLVGADSDSDTKLKMMNNVGGLVDSVSYNTNWNNPPFEFSLADGSLPTGLTLNSDGTVDGTPTVEGEVTFTVEARNSEGVTRQLDCRIIVSDPPNNEFEQAKGWSGFTQNSPTGSPDFSLSARDGWARITPDGAGYGWNGVDPENEAPYISIDDADALTGDWSLYGRVCGEGSDGEGTYRYIGIYVATGTYTGFLLGIESTTTAGTFNVFVHKADTANNVHRTTIYTDTIYVKMKHVDSEDKIYMYYKEELADSWTLAYTASSFTATPISVGFKVQGLNASSYGECDLLYYHSGALDFESSVILPTGAKDVAYSTTVKAMGGAGFYSYSISSGSLPSGLSLDSSTGVISGTPTEARSAQFTLKVTDDDSTEYETDFSLVVEEDVYFYPSVLSEATLNEAYEDQFVVYGSGTLDRSLVTIGDQCEVGLWEITFSDDTNFVITGPGISQQTGAIDEDFSISNVITIPTTAWDGIFFLDMKVMFITGISYAYQNAVDIIYALYSKGGLSETILDASSYFGDKEIGSPYEDVAVGTTTLKVKVDYPIIIKTAEVLIIEEGSNSEEVIVNIGNDMSSSFPPYIDLTITATTYAYSPAATVTWKKRTTRDTDYSFDEFHEYCEDNNFKVSITFDRNITVLQAIELISLHAGIYVGQSLGKERIAGLIERASESLQTIDSQYILKDSVRVESGEIINQFNISYGLDYIEDEYLNSYQYPETDEANNSYQEHGFKTEVDIKLPGYYDPSTVQTLAALYYKIFGDGPRYVYVGLDLMAILTAFGDRFDLDSSVPDIETVVEVIGFTMHIRNGYYFTLKTIDRSHLTT